MLEVGEVTNDSVRQFGERDRGEEIQIQEWGRLICENWRFSVNIGIKENWRKVINMWYYTQCRLQIMFPGISDKRW